MIRPLLRGLLGLALLLVLAVVGYVVWAKLAWADLPVEALEQRYGDAALRQADIDGVSLRYRLQGLPPSQAPVLVLIHNHFMDMRIWDDWVALLENDFSLLRFDLSGHGLTGPDPSGRYSVDRDVALLHQLLAQLNISRFTLVGSSLGGNIAFHYAASHPQQLEHLVLINSGGLPRANSPQRGQIPDWADQLFTLIPPLAFRRFLEWMVIDDARLSAAQQERFFAMFRRAGNRQAELARLRQFEIGNPQAVLAAVRAPTLILWGADNPQLPLAQAGQLAALLINSPRVERISYPGAGHVLPLERAAETAADLRRFIASAQP